MPGRRNISWRKPTPLLKLFVPKWLTPGCMWHPLLREPLRIFSAPNCGKIILQTKGEFVKLFSLVLCCVVGMGLSLLLPGELTAERMGIFGLIGAAGWFAYYVLKIENHLSDKR